MSHYRQQPQLYTFTVHRQGLSEIDLNIDIQPVQFGKHTVPPVVSVVSHHWPQCAPGPLPILVATPPAAAVTKAAPSKKRKSDTLEHGANNATERFTDIEALMVEMNDCDVVRRMIQAYIDSGEMRVGEFQRAMGVSPSAYSSNMKQNGASAGQRSATYASACEFFQRPEMNKLIGASNFRPSNSGLVNFGPSNAAKRTKKDDTVQSLDVSHILLPGEGYNGCLDGNCRSHAVRGRRGRGGRREHNATVKADRR